MHGELAKGTLSDILKQCGLTVEQFIESLISGTTQQHVGFYCVEGVGGVGEPPRSKILFQVAQKAIARGFAGKADGDAFLVVGDVGRRGAKFAYA